MNKIRVNFKILSEDITTMNIHVANQFFVQGDNNLILRQSGPLEIFSPLII